MKHKEEEKAEKQWESDILSGLHLSQHNSGTGGSSGKSSTKTPGSKASGVSKDKTPMSNKSTVGSSFGSSLKNKKVGGPAAKSGIDIKKR